MNPLKAKKKKKKKKKKENTAPLKDDMLEKNNWILYKQRTRSSKWFEPLKAKNTFKKPKIGDAVSSRKHTYIILTPLNPTFI